MGLILGSNGLNCYALRKSKSAVAVG
jgi:hypothetical protein